MNKFVVFILIGALSMPARGAVQGSKMEMFSAADLAADCKSAAGSRRRAFCEGYIRGVWHGQKQACVPTDTTVAQAVDAFVRHVQKFPRDADMNAGGLVSHVLKEAYPCSSSGW
jgi:hypothetical protein